MIDKVESRKKRWVPLALPITVRDLLVGVEMARRLRRLVAMTVS